MKRLKIRIFILLYITLFLIGIISIPMVNSNNNDNIKKSSIENIDFIFEKNTLFDSFDMLEKDLINLKINDYNTMYYNSTYDFNFKSIGSIPLGWIDESVGNGIVQVGNIFVNHKRILNIKVIDEGNAIIKQIFDDGQQTLGTIEFWMSTINSSNTSYCSIYSNDVSKLSFRISNDNFLWHDGSWQTLDTIPLDNTWYHIKLELNSITDKANIYIDNYFEGNYGFSNLIDSFDEIRFICDTNVYYETNIDAIGYSWSRNYTIGNNKHPIIEITDILAFTNDKYEFNLDSNNNPYIYETNPDIYNWNKIGYVYLDDHIENINSENINGIVMKGINTWSYLQNNSLQIIDSKINISFGFKFKEIIEINSFFKVIIKGFNNDIIINLLYNYTINGISFNWYNGSNYLPLFNIKTNQINLTDIHNINIYIENYEVKLIYKKNYLYNNTYIFPLLYNKSGINSISFQIYDGIDDSNYFSIRLNYIGIYQYNISLSRELGFLKYNLINNWYFNKINLFQFNSSEYIKVLTHSFTQNYFYIFKEFTKGNLFVNLINRLEIIENPFLYLIVRTKILLLDYIFFSIEGIKVKEYRDNIYIRECFPYYEFINVNCNHSYYYVDNLNRLNFKMLIENNDIFETMILRFSFTNIYSTNKYLFLTGKIKNIPLAYSYYYFRAIPYSYNYIPIKLTTLLTNYDFKIPNELYLYRFYLLITDLNNNSLTESTYEGFINNLRIGTYEKYIESSITILTLSLVSIMIPIIVIIIPTFAIYGVIKKKDVIIPLLTLMTIICFVSSLIPFELFFMMLICFGCGIFLQQKYKKEYD